MPFLIKNISKSRRELSLNLDGSFIILPHGQHTIINTASVPVDVFAHSLRGDVVVIYVQQDSNKGYFVPSAEAEVVESKPKAKAKKEKPTEDQE